MKTSHYIVLILVVVVAGAFYYYQHDKARNQDTQTAKTEPLPIPDDSQAEIQHPVPGQLVLGDDSTEEPATESEDPLPLLMESDNRIREILSEIFGTDLAGQVFQEMGIIHQFVVTVDSLTGKSVPLKYRLLPPVPGKFLVQKDSSDIIIMEQENFVRYETYMKMFSMLDTEQFVKWYTRFYPLIQEDYDSLGYKNRYFNDRFISVIDHLLETPEIAGSIELVQPNVIYEFADPALQKLSAGQKTLLRIGPANREIVRARLIEIRNALATLRQVDRTSNE